MKKKENKQTDLYNIQDELLLITQVVNKYKKNTTALSSIIWYALQKIKNKDMSVNDAITKSVEDWSV